MRYLLIVEDEPEIRATLEELFLPPEYEVMSASNGKEASRLVNRNHFDVILTDYKMPWVDGADFYARVRKIKTYETTPIIFITGFMGEISTNIISDPNVTVVDKPVDFVFLQELVDKVFEKIEASAGDNPKPKVDIQLIDLFMKSIESVVGQITNLETVVCLRPFVFKKTDHIVSDVIETMHIESDQINGYFSLVFRADTYKWMMSFLNPGGYNTIEEAIEDQGGRISRMIQKSLWKKLKLDTAEGANRKFKIDIQTKQRFSPQDKAPIIVPVRAGFGEMHAAIKLER